MAASIRHKEELKIEMLGQKVSHTSTKQPKLSQARDGRSTKNGQQSSVGLFGAVLYRSTAAFMTFTGQLMKLESLASV